jgi:hypothetical protein
VTEPEKTAAPAAAPAPEKSSADARDQLLRDFVKTMKDGQLIQEQLLKEHTQAVMANTAMTEKMIGRLIVAIEGLPPSTDHPKGVEGLTDMIEDLRDVADPLGEAVTATNITLARYAYVFDSLVDINTGDPEGEELPFNKEPEPAKVYKTGRTPNLMDVVGALRSFDAEAEAEAKKQEEEEAKAKQEAEQRAASAPAAKPSKPAMMGNSKAKPPLPVFKALPPLPVAPPMPGAAK